MTDSKKTGSTRRGFLKGAGQVAAASALAGVAVPSVHAAGDDTIRIALVGCGGRGTGAAANALSVEKGGPLQLVAMADVFPERLKNSYHELEQEFSSKMDVPEDRRFIGFDAYQKAMECLRPGDIVLLTTPPAFRWVQFSYAISRGLNTFMEKPITVDGPTTRRMLALGEEAEKKNLKVGVGLMCRHCDARKELFDRIQNGEIGEILTLRAYRQTGPVGMAFTERTPEGFTDLMWQVKRFHGFLWASGGCYSDFLIHNIDESCWMKDAWPVEAKASGGRLYRGDCIDQNFDHYSVEYTFADGTKLFLEGRNVDGCHNEFASYAHGTRGSAVISSSSHTPAHSRIYDDHRIGNKKKLVWAYPEPEANPYQLEWNDL
ncbi:MAG TPA: Gfo/Idh/MocA family oxidoreductase, partial [Isosphaeraceae bacterium]|nr:Gfo/Idh/MocA family oxidoreductase [Isosphaeraceae bacterium]